MVFANSSNSVVGLYDLIPSFSQQLLWCTANVSHKHYKAVIQKGLISYLAPKWKRISAKITSFAMAGRVTLNVGFLVIRSESLRICLDLTFNRWLFHSTVCKQIRCQPSLGNAKPLKPAYITDLISLISGQYFILFYFDLCFKLENTHNRLWVSVVTFKWLFLINRWARYLFHYANVLHKIVCFLCSSCIIMARLALFLSASVCKHVLLSACPYILKAST